MSVRTYCGKCGDSGSVTIWHPDTLSSLRRGDDPVILRDCAVGCTCQLGARFTHKLVKGESVKWLDCIGDRLWHCLKTIRLRATNEGNTIYRPADDVRDFGTELLQKFIRSNPARPPNYVDAFDKFNQGELA